MEMALKMEVEEDEEDWRLDNKIEKFDHFAELRKEFEADPMVDSTVKIKEEKPDEVEEKKNDDDDPTILQIKEEKPDEVDEEKNDDDDDPIIHQIKEEKPDEVEEENNDDPTIRQMDKDKQEKMCQTAVQGCSHWQDDNMESKSKKSRVKREHNQPPSPRQHQQQSADQLAPISLTSTSGKDMIQSPTHERLTPPLNQAKDCNGDELTAMTICSSQHRAPNKSLVVKQNMMYPGTLPDTPPVSISPPLPPPPPYPISTPYPNHLFQDDPLQQPPVQDEPDVEDMMQQSLIVESQPLDLGPNYDTDNHDESIYPSSTEDVLSDDELMHMKIRDLNKRLVGLPKNLVAHLKQKRRTLKNRNYARTLRCKRVNQNQVMELEHKALQAELKRTKSDLDRITLERDHYKRRCDTLEHALTAAGCKSADDIHSLPR